jgi:hypothetical protein
MTHFIPILFHSAFYPHPFVPHFIPISVHPFRIRFRILNKLNKKPGGGLALLNMAVQTNTFDILLFSIR